MSTRGVAFNRDNKFDIQLSDTLGAKNLSMMIAVVDTTRREKMKSFCAIALVLAMTMVASAQQTTIRDASGRTTATITTDSNGTQTFRDGSGRTTGTATRDSNGTTTFRDRSGRTTGTATAPRR